MLLYDVARSVLAERSAVDPGEIQLFYTRRITPAANRASGDEQAENDYRNREPIWPQSYGLKDNIARTDVHNLVPVDRPVNSSRGYRFFDEAGTPQHECSLCRESGEAWAPAPAVQGDVARIAFYITFATRGRTRTPCRISRSLSRSMRKRHASVAFRR